jgi:hypothetical protein
MMLYKRFWVELCDYDDMPADRAIIHYCPGYGCGVGCGDVEGSGWGDGDAYGNGDGNSSRAYYLCEYLTVSYSGENKNVL